MPTDEPSHHARRRIGFAQPPPIRMEEEERVSDFAQGTPIRLSAMGELSPEDMHRYLEQLMEERRRILDAIDIEKLSPKDKFRLLEENRSLLRGGSPYKFSTEKVIYAILAFSAVVLLTLAWLTAFHNLAEEVTITFAGTVVGGTIATIAQKLGKVGR